MGDGCFNRSKRCGQLRALIRGGNHITSVEVIVFKAQGRLSETRNKLLFMPVSTGSRMDGDSGKLGFSAFSQGLVLCTCWVMEAGVFGRSGSFLWVVGRCE